MEKKEYQPLIIPKLNWSSGTLNDSFGELTVQPLEPGFGITLGNALRRVLLGGVEGSAVTSIIIKGVNNEFSSVPGVIDDTMQIILNIKQIIIRNRSGKPGKMSLHVKGESVARVADIQCDDHLELINADHTIARLAPDGELHIEFFVEPGRGYRLAQWPKDKALQDDNRIYLDAMFSPIKKVSFEVEKTRVGGEIDYDKLIFQVFTNSAISPVDAVHYSVSVLRTQLEHFLANPEIPFNDLSQPSDESGLLKTIGAHGIGEISGVPVDILVKRIEELELPVRAHNCLINAGVERILDLVNLTEDEALKIKNFGRKSLNEVKESLRSFGLSFGMNIKSGDLGQALESQKVDKKNDK